MELKAFSSQGLVILLLTTSAISLSLSGVALLDKLPIAYTITTGVILIALLLWQASIVFKRLLRMGGGASDIMQHKTLGVITTLVFMLHVSGMGYQWTAALWLSFVIVALSSLAGRSQFRYQHKNLFFAQYALHSLAGAAVLMLGFWHGITAIAFS